MSSGAQRKTCFPQRYILVLLIHLGHFMDYAMRVNLSVTIVAMVNSTSNESQNVTSKECPVPSTVNKSAKAPLPGPKYDWSVEQQGLILSSFYWGYFVLQIGSGTFAQRYGAKKIFGLSIFLAGVLTLLTPLMSSISLYLLIGLRALMGLVRGVSYPTMAAMLGRWAPSQESTLLFNIADSGSIVGTVVEQLVAGLICASDTLGGWPSVFYITGGVAILWFIPWCFLAYDSPAVHPRISPEERHYIESNVGGNQEIANSIKVPWLRILCSPPMVAYIINMTVSSYLFFTLLTNLPLFLSEILHFDISSDGILSSLPYIAYAISSYTYCFVCDRIISTNKISKTVLRKVFTIWSLWGAGICVFATTLVSCNGTVVTILLITGYTFYGGNYAGFYANPLDLSPEFSGTVFGIANTMASMTGIITPIITSAITKDKTIGEWNLVFYITSGLAGVAGLIYLCFGSGEKQNWANLDTEEEAEPINVAVNDDDPENSD